MESRGKIIKAIKEKRVLAFEYTQKGKAKGIRLTHPHIFHKTKNGHYLLEVFKLDNGVSSTPNAPLSDWRAYTFSYISNIEIMDENFEIASHIYKPNSNQYKNSFIIAKV